MTAPAHFDVPTETVTDLRELQAEFDREGELLELQAEAEQQRLAVIADRANRIATRVLLTGAAIMALACMTAQIAMGVGA